MKSLQYAALIALLSCTLSCREPLPEDQSDRFAATVAYDIHHGVLQAPLCDISTIHKASSWLDCLGDESAQHQIEDQYFSKIALRSWGNKVTVITSSGEIEIDHNNLSIEAAGAQWSIPAEQSFSGKKITLSNNGSDEWLCTQEEPNGEVTLQFTLKWSAIDNYTFSMEGDNDTIYSNSPVVAQHFVSSSTLAAKVLRKTPYAIGTALTLIDGSFKIELLDQTSSKIAGDDIEVTFQDNSSEYYYEQFNPLIEFRGKQFYYTDVYNSFYYE